ncbi:fluoride efflux transporter CrcB [Neobacillus sp. WH10]|uniref:fluoride efflux transporter CrcB n=1 Tax=Neobacillus sp. WH10 TaxID=3047873 RepID=UPI0024C1F4DF|nr:fluoride efflux transporter CrcB [Neobacillus sp. WH10]WHY75649.1 fluoride efflux transporter CrcB [Neobacillus sp. WH10]
MVYIFVGLGGVTGSLLRYFLSILTVHFLGKEFPIGTLFINLTGSFFLGWMTNSLVVRKKLHPYLLTALTTGVIGSYTTFSTFCYETVHLFETRKYIFGLLYMIISFFGGLFFVKAGKKIGEIGKKEEG